MGGSIELSSRLGEGTKVTLELRLPVAQREADRPLELAGRHAIVRLAAAGTANALAAHLTALGLTVEQIPPAQPMRRGAAANLLFIDAGDQESGAAIAAQPILVDASANGSSGVRERDEQLWLHANPLKWQAVSRICVQALQPPAQPARGVAPSTPAIATPGGRVLVAEDHPISQTLIRRQLGLLGWECDVVGDGHAALDALRRHDYAMLLTDCQMPLMNGYELATAWRQYEAQNNRHARLPIIAMTANALDGEIERCRDAGMDDYLSKPVQLRPLEDKLRAWAPQTKADSPAAESVFFEDVFAAPGMEDLRAQMLQAMLKTSAADMQKLELAIAQADGELAQRTLHRVLGALQLFTNGRVMTDGRALMAADADRALVALPGYLKHLRSALDELAQASP
jgi:CheY-like chemotaxis protein